MRLTRLLPLLALATPLGAADAPAPVKPPLDPVKLINESYGFLHNREPEMTGTEYALYEKVVALMSSKPDFAMKLLEDMMANQPAVSPAFEFVLGNAYYSTNRLDLSIRHFRAAVDKYPDFIRAWTNLGVVYYTQQNYSEASACFTKSISLGDHVGSSYGLLAYCLAHSGNPLAAEMAYTQAYMLEPDKPEWVEGLVELLLNTRQYARAEAFQRQLVRLRPAEIRHWNILANLLIAQGRPMEAIAVLDTGGQFAPLDDASLLLLGDLQAQQGLNPEAVATYTKALGQTRDAGTARLLTFARTLIGTGDLDGAEKILAALPADGTKAVRVSTLETRAALFSARHAPADAQHCYEELLLLDPMHGRALLALAELQRTAGQTSRARLLCEQAAGLPDFAYQANLELANLALAERDYPASVAHLKKAISLQNSPALQDYLAQVTSLLPHHEN